MYCFYYDVYFHPLNILIHSLAHSILTLKGNDSVEVTNVITAAKTLTVIILKIKRELKNSV